MRTPISESLQSSFFLSLVASTRGHECPPVGSHHLGKKIRSVRRLAVSTRIRTPGSSCPDTVPCQRMKRERLAQSEGSNSEQYTPVFPEKPHRPKPTTCSGNVAPRSRECCFVLGRRGRSPCRMCSRSLFQLASFSSFVSVLIFFMRSCVSSVRGKNSRS